MSGKNIEDLAAPSDRECKKLLKQLPGFESLEDAVRRDRDRARLLSKSRRKGARRLAAPLRDKSVIPESLGSSRYSREVRLKLTTALCHLIEEYRMPKVKKGRRKRRRIDFVTLIPRKLYMTPEQFRKTDPHKLVKSLQGALCRAGASGASGWLIMFLDVSFCKTHEMFQLHWHGLVAGGMRKIVKNLRKQKGFKPRVRGQKVVQRKKLERHDYAPAVSYLFKSYAGLRMDIKDPKTNKMVSKKIKGALDNPWHSQYLLWRHRNRLRHMTLLMKLRVRRSGFTIMR